MSLHTFALRDAVSPRAQAKRSLTEIRTADVLKGVAHVAAMVIVLFAAHSMAGVLPLAVGDVPDQSDAAFPATFVDGLGRLVPLQRAPQRVISIFSSNTELIAYLGLGDRIVGVEEYTRYPPAMADRPKVGGRLGFSVDAVVALHPDLLIVTPARQAAHQLIEPMRRVGIPVIVLLSRSVKEVIGNLRLLGHTMGVGEHGELLAQEIERRLMVVHASVSGREQPRAVMITGSVGNGTLLVARPHTYTGDALALSGVRHALGDNNALPQVSAEAILSSVPDVLLFAGSQQALDELVAKPGWRELPAVRRGRMLAVARSEFLIPGPRTVDGIEKLAAWLNPANLAQPDHTHLQQGGVEK